MSLVTAVAGLPLTFPDKPGDCGVIRLHRAGGPTPDPAQFVAAAAELAGPDTQLLLAHEVLSTSTSCGDVDMKLSWVSSGMNPTKIQIRLVFICPDSPRDGAASVEHMYMCMRTLCSRPQRPDHQQ